MSIREHPTPWAMDRFAGDDSTTVVTDANGKIIAGPIDYRRYESCTVVDGMDEEVATLMAASPTMLEALEVASGALTIARQSASMDADKTIAAALWAIENAITAATKVKP